MEKYSIKTELDKEANKRDGYKCIYCDKTDGLETHHIIPDLEELNNLITVCHSCHKKIHGQAGCFKKGFDAKRYIPSKKGELTYPGVTRCRGKWRARIYADGGRINLGYFSHLSDAIEARKRAEEVYW